MNSRQIRQVAEEVAANVVDPEAAGTYLKVQVKRDGSFMIDRKFEKRTALYGNVWGPKVAAALSERLGIKLVVTDWQDRWCGWASDEVWFRIWLSPATN